MPKRTWKKQVDEESVKVGLRWKDALCQSKWSEGVNKTSIFYLHFLLPRVIHSSMCPFLMLHDSCGSRNQILRLVFSVFSHGVLWCCRVGGVDTVWAV